MRITSKQFQQMMATRHPSLAKPTPTKTCKKESLGGFRSKTERSYAARLEILKRTGQIKEYSYETVKIKLSDEKTYIPDFLVTFNDGHQEYHEVKGWNSKESRESFVKIAWARTLQSIPIIIVRFRNNQWMFTNK